MLRKKMNARLALIAFAMAVLLHTTCIQQVHCIATRDPQGKAGKVSLLNAMMVCSTKILIVIGNFQFLHPTCSSVITVGNMSQENLESYFL